MNNINKNTYYMTPMWLLHSAISISRAKSGKYHLTKRDNKKGYYVTIELNNISLKVPFSALFETNNKIKPIHSLSFISAIECPSAKRGLCQLNNNKITCYAVQGQKRASGSYVTKGAFKGVQCLNSYMSSQLITYCLDLIYNNDDLMTKLWGYVNKYIPILRFNLKGDFRNNQDIEFLKILSSRAFKTVFYGYTARDDLFSARGGYTDLINCNNNVYLNGSNVKYTNRFKATYDLKEWLNTNIICLGGCNNCKKCFSLRNKTILCLVHGKNQDYDLNTWLNRSFLCDVFNKMTPRSSYKLVNSDLTIKKGLLDSLNYCLKEHLGLDLEFKDYWIFRAWYIDQAKSQGGAL
jgi:hypothetical protein